MTKLKFNNSGINRKVNFSGNVGNVDVLNFNSDVYVDFTANPILSDLAEPISFYLYLDSNNYIDYAMLIYSSEGTQDTSNELIVFLKDSYLWVQTSQSQAGRQKIDITNFTNQKLFIQIKRTNATQGADIDYIKINEVSQTMINSDVSIGLFSEYLKIGTIYQTESFQYLFKLYDATIWDLTIPGRHYWKGYTGNLDSGWVDQIGDINGAVSGTTKTTRPITIPTNKKLKIIPTITFPTVVIGTQTWMAYNVNSNIVGSRVYNDDENNRLLYGGLYTYDSLSEIENAHPGFRTPTLTDYHTLSDYLGGDLVSGKKLMEAGTTYWNIGGDNTSGFGARGGGIYNGSYLALKSDGYFLTTSESICIALWSGFDQTTFTNYNNAFHLSVRLIKI